MRHPLLALCAALCALMWSAAALAAPAADGRVGEQLATAGKAPQVPACAGCHGADGMGVATFPRLAGAGAGYLAAQLAALADGGRSNPVMSPITKALSAEERSAVALYYSRLPARALVAPQGAAHDAGAWLAARGHWSADIPQCSQCHGPGGQGVGESFPPLAGLPAAYIEAQLGAWQKGERPAGPLGVMQAIAKRMQPEEIAAVAQYYGAFAAPGTVSTTPAAPTAPAASAATSGSAVPAPASAQGGAAGKFQPPDAHAIPGTEMGKVIRQGEQIFLHTGMVAKRYVGNRLACVNCHLDAGRLPNAAPMWGAYVMYPAYRSKTKEVDDFANRLRGCFMYSMNGKAPPYGSAELVALEAYSYWMAHGAPTGEKLPGAGYPKLPAPAQPPDFARGRAVYEQHCALCHGAEGLGQRVGSAQAFPPLWGSQSYNWGAGMTSVSTAAGFIKANMPYGLGGTLTDQQAWDVAQFMDSHERPQDPRFDGNVASTRKKFHDSRYSLYGTMVDGRLLGE
jgi:thiosulfate dehydrogenase